MPKAIYGRKLEALNGRQLVVLHAFLAREVERLVEEVEAAHLASVKPITLHHTQETLNGQLLPKIMLGGAVAHH